MIPGFDRFEICAAYYIIAERYHSGQWSKGYSILSRLSRMGYRPTLGGFEQGDRDAAASLLWKSRREIVKTW